MPNTTNVEDPELVSLLAIAFISNPPLPLMFADQMCCFGMRDASSPPSALNNFMMQSHTLTRGNVVVDVEVDIYYDALEYDINDAADETFIDVGLSPIHVRGGAAGSDKREGRSRTNRAARA